MIEISIIKSETKRLGGKRTAVDYEVIIGSNSFVCKEAELKEIHRSIGEFFKEVEHKDITAHGK